MQTLTERTESDQPQQVERRGPQAGQNSATVAPVAVVVFPQLGITDQVPALLSPALPNQPQQRFWCGAEACDDPVKRPERRAVAGAGGDHRHDPAAPLLAHLDARWSLLGPQHLGHVTGMTDLVIRCQERDVAFSQELTGDLPVETAPIPFKEGL